MFALMTDARDEVAVVTSESVASDPEVRPAPVKVRVVAAQTSEATDAREVRVLDENAQIDAGSEAARDDEAVFRSERVANDPAVSPAPVKVRVAFVQISETRVPKVVKLRAVCPQTEVGSVAESEVDAFKTAELVLVFTPEIVASRFVLI